jgi:hypothetical protein
MIGYSLLASIVPLLIIVGIVYLIARPRHGNGITPYQALMVYFYFVTAASVITMAVGMVYFIRVALSQAFGDGETANDLTIASVLLGTGLVICTLHIYGRRTAEKWMGKISSTPRRTYLFFMLVGFSSAGLVSLPLAIYKAIHYFIAEPTYRDYPYYEEVNPPAPSTELAVAIVVVLLWAYFMFRVLREIRQRNRGETEG